MQCYIRPGGHPVVDSEYVLNGTVEWSVKWRRPQQHTPTGEVGLWEQILLEREKAGNEIRE